MGLIRTDQQGYVMDEKSHVVINTNMSELQNYRAAVAGALKNEELQGQLLRMGSELEELRNMINQVVRDR